MRSKVRYLVLAAALVLTGCTASFGSHHGRPKATPTKRSDSLYAAEATSAPAARPLGLYGTEYARPPQSLMAGASPGHLCL